jgi:hypothetical protein
VDFLWRLNGIVNAPPPGISHHNGLFVAAAANKQARRTSLIMEFSLARFLSCQQRRLQSDGLAGNIFD